MANLQGTKATAEHLSGGVNIGKGFDGFSPLVTVEETTEGALITATDKNGTTQTVVKNGVDGKDGYTPKKGVDYKDGENGKSAYQYAQDGGYTGTEEEFAILMAQENLQTEKVSQLSKEIEDLAEISEEYWEDGANRLNPDLSGFSQGHLITSNGTLSTSDYKTSYYIDISDSVGKNAVFSYFSQSDNAVYPEEVRYCFYDINKNYISGADAGQCVEIPTNAHYIRASFTPTAMNYIERRMLIVQNDATIPTVLVQYKGMSKTKTIIRDSVIPDNIARKMKEINVTVGVGKDYTTIKEAVESIIASDDTIYNILIDDGIYNEYAITLPNNVNLIGVSRNREKCIIQGELPDTATTDEITVNSTINLMYSNRLENLTITAKNLRYPIHSESGGNVTDWVQILNNCYVEHYGNTSPNSEWTSYHAWGEGASSGAYAEFNNCVFKGDLGAWYVHEPTNMPNNPKPYHHILNNCEIINNRIDTIPYWNGAVIIENNNDRGVINTVEINNCNIGNGSVGVAGEYDINVIVHGCNNVPITRGKSSNYPNTDFTTVKTYVGADAITKNTVLMYADGINLVKKATASTPKNLIAGVATEDCEPNSLVKVIKGTYVSKTGNVGDAVYCDNNGQFTNNGTVIIGTCYGQFSLID